MYYLSNHGELRLEALADLLENGLAEPLGGEGVTIADLESVTVDSDQIT